MNQNLPIYIFIIVVFGLVLIIDLIYYKLMKKALIEYFEKFHKPKNK